MKTVTSVILLSLSKSFIMGDTSSAQREYSRNIAAYTLKQLIEWQASLERMSKEYEQEGERERVREGVKQHDSKEHARPPQQTALGG
ncbi:uncharacterized protein EDB93DRAFT_719466 [Suillus bovinus]|uniref:uncharacterized protein n=1 Tax=Suillus bovinus TaxID=48563 RepID=UPI001B86FAA2|nr:uncharacterized protein EDB93DRAFT_719466 [Suillus bovinus]KAG2138623.1 hypothetical protein EDB93DRAFT_719466 [Suillus bovinus]